MTYPLPLSLLQKESFEKKQRYGHVNGTFLVIGNRSIDQLEIKQLITKLSDSVKFKKS